MLAAYFRIEFIDGRFNEPARRKILKEIRGAKMMK